ncbi:hypothetical protein IP91_03731 [Pseudoduganella lurida]|uniref:DUF2268 domain-containing protein n=1 Tax=Pseudoduganella lurida TaxID=1036180 RepID=A0A562R224_9BURK|nr:hypothetical protein [Pseudoduganella lurida]TWI62893.1 hypothetical protein IP91_03731 [Pseudoduganella lurida]
MRRVLSVVLAALSACGITYAAPPPVHDLSLAFDAFYTRTEGMPVEARVADFRRTVGAQFPQFYGDARGHVTHAEQDRNIAAAIARYPGMREAYLRKARDFGSTLTSNVASFAARFPDYRADREIWLVHSLGEMDGGTRTLAGREYLIFGVDGMVRYHGDISEAAFYHHELFHTYHEPVLAACTEEVVWKRLWTEGLATYVSQQMNPAATEREMLLDVPRGLVARAQATLPAGWRQLEQLLDSREDDTIAGLFQLSGGSGPLPQRSGYYYGYLVAQEAARTQDVARLARLGCDDARTLVAATVHKLAGPASNP